MSSVLFNINSMDLNQQLALAERRLVEAGTQKTRDALLGYSGLGVPIVILAAGLVKAAANATHAPQVALAISAGTLACSLAATSCFNFVVGKIISNDRGYSMRSSAIFSPILIIDSSRRLLNRIPELNWLVAERKSRLQLAADGS